MNLLLDTCTFLWIVDDAPQLSLRARELFQDPTNVAYLSSVSAWEICLKHMAGRLSLSQPPEVYVPHYRTLHHIQELPLQEPAVGQLPRLSPLHRDPFDRMLICQAIYHGLVLLTSDHLITQYPVRVEW